MHERQSQAQNHYVLSKTALEEKSFWRKRDTKQSTSVESFQDGSLHKFPSKL